MATWNQNISSGGFLAGLGGNNENAPQAGSVNTTLGLIQGNNEFARAGGNNVALQGLQGLAGLGQQYKQQQQEQQEQALQAFNKAHADAWNSGDTSGLRKFAATNPAFITQAQQAVAGLNDQQRSDMTNQAAKLRFALAQGPEAYTQYVSQNAGELSRVGANPNVLAQMGAQNPQGAAQLFDTLGMAGSGDKYFDIVDKQQGHKVAMRGQDITARGQDIGAETARRGQDISAQNARRTAGGSTPASVREYQYFNSLSPEQQKTYLRVRGRPTAGGDNAVQLSDGRTVSVSGKLHGSGQNAFYEGIDDAGNMVRVPASAIAAPPTSAATAQNYAMKKDIDSIASADANQLGFMTGMTGGTGSASIDAELRSRLPGNKDERQLYNATRRIQGRMQNQGVAAARDMGASGINTVAEAKMYFQGMPQVDYSSPESMQSSIRDIQEYTDNYNQQYQVNVGGKRQVATTQPAPPIAGDRSVSSFPAYQPRQQYGQTQAQAQQTQQTTNQAPATALQALQDNPGLAQQFQAKYGYLPQGFQ